MESNVFAFAAYIIVRIILGALLPGILISAGVYSLSKNPTATLSFGLATFLILLSLAQ
jgi:hypothetical protein